MTDKPDLPRWYDPALHVASSAGILRRADGAFLAADGHALGAALRARELAAAGVTTDPHELVSDAAIAVAAAELRAGSEAAAADVGAEEQPSMPTKPRRAAPPRGAPEMEASNDAE